MLSESRGKIINNTMVGLNSTLPLNNKVADLIFSYESLFLLIYYAGFQLYSLNFVTLGIFVLLYTYIILYLTFRKKEKKGENHKPKMSEGTFPLENLPVAAPPSKSLP